MKQSHSCLQFIGQIILLGFLLFGGLAAGMMTANMVAPESQFARIVSFFMLPTSLALAMLGWWGTAVLLTTAGIARKTLQTGSLNKGMVTANKITSFPPGKISLLLIPVDVCLVAGVTSGTEKLCKSLNDISHKMQVHRKTDKITSHFVQRLIHAAAAPVFAGYI